MTEPRMTTFAGMTITRERRLEMALEMFRSFPDSALGDLETMKQFLPPSKRGRNFSRAMSSLEDRLNALKAEAVEALTGEAS